MLTVLDDLRTLHAASVFLRLTLAVFFGGLIGLERGHKRRPAGFRTYMLVCLGAALTMILSQYEYCFLGSAWEEAAQEVGARTDVSRFGAQVINGVGFLGAGTILVTNRRDIKGLTTAAGLWASACMGLAIGAGFYECVIPSFFLIVLCICCLPYVEERVLARARNMNIYVEFASLDGIGEVIRRLKAQAIHIYEVEFEDGRKEMQKMPGAIFYLRLPAPQPHRGILSTLTELDGILTVHEI